MALDDRREPLRSIDELRQATTAVADLHNACRCDQLVPLLPDLLRDLDAFGDQPEALCLLSWTTYATTFAAKYLGYPDLALLASGQVSRTASRLGDPAWLGVAEFATVHSLPTGEPAVDHPDRAMPAPNNATPHPPHLPRPA